ncbi:glucose-6-phosphate isomerase [Xanthobacter sp. V4C-4]|uniref:glucose-6-phosphate isomerase n=1 Tax=Xanthobacter cornucopiae TaxID=3119924 RepID=UPI00372AC6E0
MTATQPFWPLLSSLRAAGPRALRELNADPGRFSAFSRADGDLLLDFSKTELCAETLALLLRVAEAAGVARLRDAMFAGARINLTENRAVLHVALRDSSPEPLVLDGVDVKAQVRATLERLSAFATAIREGALVGATGRAITDVVNIGIGGSDLGPAMATLALAPYHDGPRSHFVSNVDSAHIADTLRGLDPATTLVIIASKTFTTVETMYNARTARAWITRALGEDAVSAHFAAVSTARDKVSAFGIPPERTFGFWDWVGGRYSLWSAIGLPVMLAIGPQRFAELLAGAEAMDRHFRTAPLADNLPVLLALVGLWHRDVCGYGSRAVVPYDQRLARFPAYLQQLDMESNGKRVTRDGLPVAQPTGPVVWGEPGTNAQHAFFQLLHQGTEVVPVEFLIAAEGHEPDLKDHHDLLVACCLAQSEALMTGRTLAQATDQLRAQGKSETEAAMLAPHRVFPGNRPSVTLAYRRLDPHTLGRVIALYEHRVFVEAAVWNINAFDQWGVELGKELATALLPAVRGEAVPTSASGSTRGLLAHLATSAR